MDPARPAACCRTSSKQPDQSNKHLGESGVSALWTPPATGSMSVTVTYLLGECSTKVHAPPRRQVDPTRSGKTVSHKKRKERHLLCHQHFVTWCRWQSRGKKTPFMPSFCAPESIPRGRIYWYNLSFQSRAIYFVYISLSLQEGVTLEGGLTVLSWHHPWNYLLMFLKSWTQYMKYLLYILLNHILTSHRKKCVQWMILSWATVRWSTPKKSSANPLLWRALLWQTQDCRKEFSELILRGWMTASPDHWSINIWGKPNQLWHNPIRYSNPLVQSTNGLRQLCQQTRERRKPAPKLYIRESRQQSGGQQPALSKAVP